MSELLIKNLLAEFHEKLNESGNVIKREAIFSMVANKILVAIGMRRTGKTHFLLQQVRELLNENVPISRILYINFEDDRLYPMNQQQLGVLLDAFYTTYPENHDHLCYFFLDEIQNVENWAITIRRFFDSKKIKIFLSGSSSKLLSTEIATALRGRSLATEIWPLSFSEFLSTQPENFIRKPFGNKVRDNLKKLFCTYLDQGGFPEVLDYEMSDRIETLQDYVDVVIFRDIVDRYHISNITLIRYLIKIFLKNAGTSFSVNKLFNDLKSQGFALSKMTIHEYLQYIEEAYLAFSVPLYSESLRKTNTNPRKIYAIDTGLINAYNHTTTKNQGRIFENFIFLELKRQGCEIYYYLTKSRKEVDFLAKSRDGQLHLYQVAWEVDDPKTLARELAALEEAEKELGIKGALITVENYLTDFVDARL